MGDVLCAQIMVRFETFALGPEVAQELAGMTAAGRRFASFGGAARPSRPIGAARREGEYFRRESNKVLQALTERLLVFG
jgi:hypothetical protein